MADVAERTIVAVHHIERFASAGETKRHKTFRGSKSSLLPHKFSELRDGRGADDGRRGHATTQYCLDSVEKEQCLQRRSAEFKKIVIRPDVRNLKNFLPN